ncbi:DNA replication complex GINS protein PSF1-like [Trifolium pratense]|uniref:DNA replication complex GINS protein PSF1-like n=1 Tax=Trifolium pratense TaxID=57577 RepID=A0A2K3PH71_TRIPR|nr:DNA replication complex GINS protein PSF1-like [Trifolium pratense]
MVKIYPGFLFPDVSLFFLLVESHGKMQEEGLDIQTARNADHYGALIHLFSIVRNKCFLTAYVYNRAAIYKTCYGR